MSRTEPGTAFEDLRVSPGRQVRLVDVDTSSTGGLGEKREARGKLKADIERLAKLHDVFYARSSHALLVILQGMDTAGKDGVIKHVMSGANPQGVYVFSFGPPSAEELAHDYLWRCARVVPARGRIAIFNRSYYEETTVVRVHPELLAGEGLSPAPSTVWDDRFADINAFERYLVRNGVVVLKFFLHISRAEQRDRLLARLDDPAKLWKLSAADLRERQFWDDYVAAYDAAISQTSTEWAPWYVIPADHKWFARIAVADIIVHELKSLRLTYPQADERRRAELEREREALARET